MKKFVVIVILFGCTSSYAGFLYTLKQVSFFYGKTFYYQGTNFHTLELQYDSKKSGCKGAKPYFGAGLVYGFNQNQEILGVKGMFTPPRINLPITRKSKMRPDDGVIRWVLVNGSKSITTKDAIFEINDSHKKIESVLK